MCENSMKRFFWKRKRVTENVYNSRVRQQTVGKNLRNVYGCNKSSKQLNLKNVESDSEREKVIEGRRIVHIKTLGKQLICNKCNCTLSLLNTVDEIRIGLASVLIVKCEDCQSTTRVCTDKTHKILTKSNQNKSINHYDLNTSAAMGALNAGLGRSHLNKVLASFDVPTLHSTIYSAHVKEVGTAAEEMAEDRCMQATLEERELTIKNVKEFQKLLPDHLKNNFIFPSISDVEHGSITEVAPDTVVRIAAAYDMGWPTRGTGREYDSLSGSAALIGFFSKKIISYTTKNRKCRMCDLGHDPKDHDCRLNFTGSAKAMEPAAAAELANHNEIFKACNVELGIMIGDNDSSSISAIRTGSSHEVIKHSDKNHTSKGVTNELYKIQKEHKELNAKSIKYLKRCFSYCVSQNANDKVGMAAAIKNIPHHAFNDHTNCGTWCGFKSNPETYKHSVIGIGFQSPKLFDALKCLFYSLATKVDRFAAGVSSNGNESLNTVIASKAPKSRFYGGTVAYDFRVAFAINKKNAGEEFANILNNKISSPTAHYTTKYYQALDSQAKKRYIKASTREFKKKRLFLKKQKSELRQKKENVEGSETYRSDIGLLNTDVPPILNISDNSSLPIIIYFDIETGSFSKDADILQIAAKYNDKSFSVYITPTQNINEKSSEVTGLRVVAGKLQYLGKIVSSVTLSEALQEFYKFLSEFNKKCILVAHNCSFDRPRLLAAIEKTFLLNHFESVVYGFGDTLPLIKKETGFTKKGENKLENLATIYNILTENAHNAINDVIMLEKVMVKLGISHKKIVDSTLTWVEAIKCKNYMKSLPSGLKKLEALNSCTSLATRKKIVAANISYQLIIEAFKEYKLVGLINLFGEDENGMIKVTKSRSVVKKISEFLEKSAI